jgi:serine/threonine protein kinase
VNCPKCLADNPPDTLFCGKCGAKFEVGASRVKPKGPGGTEFDSKPRPLSVTRTIETTPDGLGKGELFAGRFELIEELGAGGMGIVYRAYDKQVGEEIALKILHPEIALDERTVDRFRNEIKLARRISHRNVCRMHELHEDGKTLFITMEYVSGQDLKGLIKESGALTTGKAISVAKQAAEGLCEAHNLGVIHRDLKPQNIMVDKEGTAKIMDFGIARSLRAAGMTAEGMIIGTPEYMAPEQVEGLEADQRTDLYAFGAILFEMVTGRVPFEGDSPLSVAYKHKNEVPISPRKLNAEIPEPFNKLILRCLEKQKENRYQTAEDLLADLIRIEEGLPISERVALPARPTIRIARERRTGIRRLLVPALIVTVLAVSGVLIWRLLPKKPTSPASASGKPSIALLYLENLTGDPALNVWKSGLAKLLTMSLAESKLVSVLDENSTYGILRSLKLDEAARYTREDLVKIADEAGVSHTVSGSLMRAGESIIILLTLQEPRTGEVADPIKLTCRNDAEIYSRTDELAAQIKSALDLSPAQVAADKGVDISGITASPEAMKYYLESLSYYNNVEYTKMRLLAEKAVELDPDFALPYLLLYIAPGPGGFAKSREYMNKAFGLRERLPLRDRYNVEGNYYQGRGEDAASRAIEAYSKYLELAPRDAGALQSLYFLYGSAGDYAKSREYAEKAYRAEPTPQQLCGVLVSGQATGQLDWAEKVLKDHYRNYPDNRIIQFYSCYFYVVQRKYDQALAEIERGYLNDPSPNWSWDLMRAGVYLYQGKTAEAEAVCRRVIDKAEKPGYVEGAKLTLMAAAIYQGKKKKALEYFDDYLASGGRPSAGYPVEVFPLAYELLRLGRFGNALEIIETRLKQALDREFPESMIREALWWKGIALVEKGSLAEAEMIALDLKGRCDRSPYKIAQQTYEHLRGLIDLGKGEYAKAIDHLSRACSWLTPEAFDFRLQMHDLHYFPLGIAYYRSGDMAKAWAEIEKVPQLTAGMTSTDLRARSFYWLGKIAEAQKDKRRASENYGKFLDLLKDADPGQPEVDDAKARLAAL